MSDRSFSRRRFGAGLAVGLLPAWAQAQSPSSPLPARPVRIVVPYPPGGTTDLLARLMAARLAEPLRQSFVVENRPGASGAIGAQAVARANPDGSTLLMGTISTHGVNAALYRNLPYDTVRDFAPVTLVASTPNVVAVNPASPVRTMAELLALARARPGKLSFGSTSQGGSPHMSAELLKMMAGLDMVHVPYKGASPMLADLMGGQIDLGFDNLPSTLPLIRSGKLRGLAVTTAQRWPGAPELPTLAESGVPGYDVGGWFGLFAPAGTPAAVLQAIQQAVAAQVKLPDVQRQMLDMGAEPVGNTPEEFARRVSEEVRRWRTVVDTLGLKVE